MFALCGEQTIRCFENNSKAMPPQYIRHYHKEVHIDCSNLKRCILRSDNSGYYQKQVQLDFINLRRCILQTVENPCPLI